MGLPTYKRARMGIGRTYQRVEVFTDMTVRDHLLVAERSRQGEGRLWRDLLNLSKPKQEEIDRVDATLEMVGISNLADTWVNALGLGHCRLVELARALAAEPKILLADEPSSGLDLHETSEVAAVLRTVQREHGTAVLLVEHDLAMVSEVVDRAVVMDLGSMLFAGTFDECMGDPAVRDAYLGQMGQARRRLRLRHRSRRTDVLSVSNVSAAYGPYRALFDVSFRVPDGGIVALVGSNGAGKSTVARTVTGLVTASSGQVIFCGEDVTALPAYKIARLGMAHVVEGRGVFSTLTVEENLTLAFRQRDGRIKLKENLERAYTAFPILGERRRQPGEPSPVANSVFCRWRRSSWCRPRSWWPTSSPWAWLRWWWTPCTRDCWRSTATAPRWWWSSSRSTGSWIWPIGPSCSITAASPTKVTLPAPVPPSRP